MRLINLAFLIPAILSVSSVKAETYQSFSTIGYFENEYGDNLTNSDSILLATQYYFDKRMSLGPFNEFNYINTISSVSVSYAKSNYETNFPSKYQITNSKTKTDNFTIGGEWFVGDFLVGAGYSYNHWESENCVLLCDNDLDTYRMTLGYLISDNLLVKVNTVVAADYDTRYTFDVNYNLQLNQLDYVGFGYNSNEDFDYHHLSARYFMALSSESFLTLGGSYLINNVKIETGSGSIDFDDVWGANIGYYFNQATSISANYGNDDSYGLSANHFFNKNYSLGINYHTIRTGEDSNSISATFMAQF
ncbi:MAG: putative porin [Colwellia sp.]|nr:putative porin [Colwellia sp.]